MAKSKVHELVIKVRFDKPCTLSHAHYSVRDCIHGDFYPYQPEDNYPGEFKVAAIKRKGRKS